MLADPVKTENRRHQPADGRKEGERLIRLPRAAVGAMDTEIGPVEGAAAAATKPVDEEAEHGEPGDGQDEVNWPVDERAREGQQPEDGQQNRQAGDDLGIDEAAEVPG